MWPVPNIDVLLTLINKPSLFVTGHLSAQSARQYVKNLSIIITIIVNFIPFHFHSIYICATNPQSSTPLPDDKEPKSIITRALHLSSTHYR
jgi:hypothetical protein